MDPGLVTKLKRLAPLKISGSRDLYNKNLRTKIMVASRTHQLSFKFHDVFCFVSQPCFRPEYLDIICGKFCQKQSSF